MLSRLRVIDKLADIFSQDTKNVYKICMKGLLFLVYQSYCLCLTIINMAA